MTESAIRDPEPPLVAVSDLVKHFPIRSGILLGRETGAIRAVDGIGFTIGRGETLGLVGESGCGKSTVGRLLVRLIDPTAGSIRFEGMEIATLAGAGLRSYRSSLQMVFQDPFSSLNPRQTVGDIVGEPLYIHGRHRSLDVANEVTRVLETVGLASYHASRYPHEFSGGQRQRICIARALVLRPRIIVCDEAVSALDVSIQGQIVNLLQDLQDEFGIAYLFISHNLGVVRRISHRVAVMYLGKIVEIADSRDLFRRPLHPYTEALISAALPARRRGDRRKRILLGGDVPSPATPPAGCRFHTRCAYATETCRQSEPALRSFSGRHQAACHRIEEIRPPSALAPETGPA